MNAQAIAQVAQSLGVSPNQIKRCEEWASVIFVVVHGRRGQFVSKKVAKMADSRIPQSLEEARKLAEARFHTWDADCVAMVEKILSAGRQVDVMGQVDPISLELKDLSNNKDDSRLVNGIAKISVALGAKVRNY